MLGCHPKLGANGTTSCSPSSRPRKGQQGLRVPHAGNPLDKQIAATALMYGLTVVTRNVPHYELTGVAVLNPFT